MGKSTGVESGIQAYLERHRTPDDPLLEELRKETERRYQRRAGMQISAAQGTFMRMLVAAIGARSALEIGTFTGYSSISIARGLAPGGRLLACDINEEWTSIARGFWQRAGLADRIELRLGPALDTLRALPVEESLDFAFIDADKNNYAGYYEETLRRLRPNGLIVFDNMLWGGSVLDPTDQSEDTVAIRALNEQLSGDARVDCTLLAVADGLMLVRKRG